MRPLADGALFDPFVHRVQFDDAVDEDAGGDDVVRIDLPGFNQVLDLHHHGFAGGGHDRIEVPRGLSIDQIALGVGLPGMDDRQIGAQSALLHIQPAVEFLLRLALGDLRARPGGGEERRNPGAARADSFRQRALRVELDLQFAGQVLLGEGGVLADVGADHLPHLPGLQQHPQPDVVDAGVVGDDGQVLDAAVADRLDQGRWGCRTGRIRRT